MAQREVKADKTLVAYCGLYCGACRSYLKGSCPGCHENSKASWCQIRACCAEHNYQSCADCKQYPDAADCAHFKGLMPALMALLFNSNRPADVRKIRELGLDGYAAFMAERKLQTLPRRGSLES